MPYPDGSPEPWEQILDPAGLGGRGVDANGNHASNPGQYVTNSINNLGSNIGNFWNSISGARTVNPNVGNFNQNAGQGGNNWQANATTTADLGGANQDQARNGQMALIQQLQDQAAGRGPSLAQMQLQRGTDQNISQAMALGQSQRGAGQAGMLKGIQGQQAGLAQGMAGDAAMARLQEQMAAQGQLGQQLGGMRGQDQGWAGMNAQNNQFNAGQLNQNSQFNVGQANTLQDSAKARAQQAAIEQAKLDMEREKLKNDEAKQSSPAGFIGGVLAAL